MARTYLSTNNSRGGTVTAMSPTYAHFRGWNVGVYIHDGQDEENRDKFSVYMTGGSHNESEKVLLGFVHYTPDGPVWEPKEKQ
jgi:hypothetical protein